MCVCVCVCVCTCIVKVVKEEAWKRLCDAEGVRGGEEFKKLPKK